MTQPRGLTRDNKLSWTLYRNRLCLATVPLCAAMLFYSASSLSTELSPVPELQVIDSPAMKIKANRIFSWHVDSATPSGYKSSVNSTDTTLTQHNKLSILAHAKSVSNDNITSIQHPSEQEITNTSFRLVGYLPSTHQKATDMQSSIAILPEVQQIRYQSSMETNFTPTDTCFQFQPEIHSLGSSFYNNSANIPDAWSLERGQGSPDVIIGILDSGIVKHVDHDSTRMIVGSIQDFISSPVQASDGDGRDNDPSDPGLSSNCLYHSQYHGTHVAGKIGADSNNANGITGVNWLSNMIPVRVLGPKDGSSGDIVDAVNWIQDIPKVRVINMSFGSTGKSCEHAFFWKPHFITEAFNKNILTVVAAGNNHSDAADFSPANCADAIAVAATNEQGRKAYYSNYGLEIDISAPGGEIGKNGNKKYGILSTVNANRYEYKQGTSVAAPIVSGIASLVLSRTPELTPAEVKNILKATATAFQAVGSHGVVCDTEICGAGIVNAAAAVQHASITEPPIIFFPRQTQHALPNKLVRIDVLLSKKSTRPSTFTVLASSADCTLRVPKYEITLPAGDLKHELTIQESNCAQQIDFELITPAGSPLQLSTANVKHLTQLIFIDTANIQTETQFEEIHWSYLEPNSQGNIHSVFLKEPGTYYMSTISDMNSELVITNAQSEVLFDSREQDPEDINKVDYWAKYTLTRSQLVRFTVLERIIGNGGIYAVSITTVPDFSDEVASYCQAPLGVKKQSCSVPNSADGQDDSLNQTVISYEKTSSINIYFLIAMLFLAAIAATIRLRSLRLN